MKSINNKRTYIVIPSYEPDERLVDLVNSLIELDFDVVLINDGSKESFDYIFDQVKEKVTYIRSETNKGKGHALRLGFSHANINSKEHDFVITCDGDGQHSLNDIIRINQRLLETNRPVFGVRKFDENVPKRSRNGNFMSRLSRSLITKDFIQDDQCGLRGFPIYLLNELISIRGDHYEYEMNVVCFLQLKRYPIEQIDIETIYIDGNSTSHFSPRLDTYRIQVIIWQYALIPVIAFLFGITCYILTSYLLRQFLSFKFDYLLFFTWSQWFSYFTYFGLISLFFPTKQIGRRSAIEGIFFSVKGTIALGLFLVFVPLLKIPGFLGYIFSTFIVCFINYFLSYFIYTIRKRKNNNKE